MYFDALCHVRSNARLFTAVVELSRRHGTNLPFSTNQRFAVLASMFDARISLLLLTMRRQSFILRYLKAKDI